VVVKENKILDDYGLVGVGKKSVRKELNLLFVVIVHFNLLLPWMSIDTYVVAVIYFMSLQGQKVKQSSILSRLSLAYFAVVYNLMMMMWRHGEIIPTKHDSRFSISNHSCLNG